MNLHSFRLKNFRRLKDVHIDLDPEISIFVGANNSGKTSATHALKKFVAGSKADFSFHDFSASCWSRFDALGDFVEGGGAEKPICPTISIDLWFAVQAADLHRVVDLLPGLEWASSLVGVRIELIPTDIERTVRDYRQAKAEAGTHSLPAVAEQPSYQPWPINLSDYLKELVSVEFELRYFVLDRARFDDDFRELDSYDPPRIVAEKGGQGASVIDRLMRVDLMDAQRYLSENSSGGRAEDLSRCLGRFYKRNLEQLGTDYGAMGALAGSQEKLNDHLAKVFGKTLQKLSMLGYPGLGNPKIEIKTTLNPSTILSSNDGARVYYALEGMDESGVELSLPDQYNGLGFKNLIYMVVELLDLDARWRQTPEDMAPLHVVIIEEPEAHMHAQLQQVFIREILALLAPTPEDSDIFKSQFLITTHSSHILYERGFQPIRYFRRGEKQQTEVINLSAYYRKSDKLNSDFLERYLKITHCDLFFADAAILVEGNVERLLMPLFISKAAQRLSASCLTILEVGGAYGHCFKSLIEYLGVTCLVVTDIDSVNPPAAVVAGQPAPETADDDEEESTAGKACAVNTPDAVTCNQTLIQWLPAKRIVADLLAASEAQRIQEATDQSRSCIRVCYQSERPAKWKAETQSLAGRTLEEAFALENLIWTKMRHERTWG